MTSSTLVLHKIHSPLKLISDNWTGNLNYWTGGMQGCKGFWGWCAGSKYLPFTANMTWGLNQPELFKEKENCLHLRVFQNKSGVVLNDRECKDKYIIACEVINESTLIED